MCPCPPVSKSIPSKDDQLSNEEVDLWWQMLQVTRAKMFPFPSFCCNLNVEAVDISFFMGTHSAFHERLWFDFAGWLKDSFLGYDLRVLPSLSFFVDEEVEILCRQFPIVFTKEYIDVYNDEDKRHLCEDAGSFLTPLLLSTICIYDCVDQIRWVWGFSLSLSLSLCLSLRLEVALKPSRLTRTHTHTHMQRQMSNMLKAQVLFVQRPQAHRVSI